MNEYINMWKNFADFSNRANKRDYWMAYLIHVLVSVVVALLAQFTTIVIYWIYLFVIIIPSVSLMIRRLRDAGKEWYWIFISLIPCVGIIILIYFLIQPSVTSTSDWNTQ